MIAIAGKNPVGNVLHLIMGPETDLVIDVQGSQIMDISALLNKFSQSAPVFVNISRSRNESMTSDSLKQAGVPHVGISAAPAGCDGECELCDIESQRNGMHVARSAGKDKDKAGRVKIASKNVATGVCSYCKKTTTLLPIPGFKICVSCAQIELGLKDVNKGKSDGNADGKV